MTVSEKLRLVQGLHSHAEMFGFHWDDGSDWTWHDVACQVADEVDAENAKLREACAELLKMAESSDPEWLHWPEMHDELQELGVKMSNFKKLSAYADAPCEWVSAAAPRNNKNYQLKAENAKLRELLLYIADMLGKNINLRELCEESANLRAENAGLRKLLLDVWSDAIRFDGFWDYVMDDGELYNKDELPHYQERMRELGIEVDGC